MSEEKLKELLESIPKMSKEQLLKLLEHAVKFDYAKEVIVSIENSLKAHKARELAINDALVIMSEGDK